jgi:hypothetical protein
MLFKANWETARERMIAWWAGEELDRALMQVTARRPGEHKVPPPANLEQQWLDVDHVLARTEESMRLTYYAGEALPVYYPNLGPDVFAAYMGCDLEFGTETSWSVPLVRDWSDLPKARFDRGNKWWRLTLRMLEEAGQRLGGKCLLGVTDLHGGGDGVAALRDPLQLNLDLIEHPDEVKAAMRLVQEAWFPIYDGEYDIIKKNAPGSTAWLSVWSPGRYFPVSCDFCTMVSPAMFQEFFLPELLAEIEWLDHSIYHLDGPGALRHLDTLLAIPKLGGIQWVPGANRGPMMQWLPVLKRIQAAGKLLHIYVEDGSEIEPLLRTLSPKGLCISCGVASVEEADDLLRLATRIAREQRRG